MSKDLPSSWAEVPLSEIGLLNPPSVTPSRWPDKKWELWSVPSFPSGHPERIYGRAIGSNKQLVAPNDVLLCKINPRINRVWKVAAGTDLDQIASTEWIVIRSPAIDPDYLTYLLREPGFRTRLCANVSGVGGSLTRARPKIVSSIEVGLAPRAEQRRIADKITTLDTHSRAARKHLDAIPPLLEQFRASVLSAAFSGRLTADWRAEQKRKGVKIEPADALLERMRVERRQRWEAEQLARMKAKGQKPKDDTWKAKYKEPEPVDTTGLPELPTGWLWASMSALAECALGKMLDKTKHTTGIKLPYLRNINVRWDGFQTTDLLSMFFRKHEIERYQIRKGDAVVCEGGEPGRTAVWHDDNPVMYQKALHRLRPFGSMDAQWFVYHLFLDAKSGELNQRFTGTTIKHFTGQQMAAYPVRLPPLAELHEIIRRVRQALSIQERVKNEVTEGYERIGQLDNGILAKAFRGELVPQDPNDEPATELLKRIAEEKEKIQAAKKETPRKGVRRGK